MTAATTTQGQKEKAEANKEAGPRSPSFFSRHRGFGLGLGMAGLGIGIGTGLALRLPIFPPMLPSALTPIFSSFAGALVGAGAAGFWAQLAVKRGEEALKRGDEEACRTVAKAIRPVPNEITVLQDQLAANDVNPHTISTQLKKIEVLRAQAEDRLRLLSTLHSQMRDGKGIAIADAQIALKDLQGPVQQNISLAELEKQSQPQLLAPDRRPSLFQSSRWANRLTEQFDAPQGMLLDAMRQLGHPLNSARSLYSD
jgi:uncharacterized membrane protein YccC